jgi:hypothetical protein
MIPVKEDIWEDAFYNEMYAIWGKTKFKDEVSDLAFMKAHAIYLRDTMASIKSRRDLLYYYMAPKFSTDQNTDTLNKLYKVLPTSNAYVKRAINNLCTVYDKAPSVDLDDEEFVEILEEALLFTALQNSYNVDKLINEVAAQPRFINNELEIKVWTPDLYRTVYNEFGVLTEFWMPFDANPRFMRTTQGMNPTLATDVKFKVITQTETYTADSDGVPDGATRADHGYVDADGNGIVPVQIRSLSSKFGDSLEVTGGTKWELIRAQLENNELNLQITQTTVSNSFPIGFGINLGVKENDIKLSPDSLLAYDGVKQGDGELLDPSLDYIAQDAQYSELEVLKDDKMRKELANEGLPTSLIDSNPGLAASGVAMQVDRIELNEIRAKDINILEPLDKELIELTRIVVNNDEHSPYIGKFKKPFEFTITYSPLDDFVEPEADYNLKKQKWTDDVLTTLDFVNQTSENNFGTDDEAVKFMKDNSKTRQEARSQNGESEEDSGAGESFGGEDRGNEPIEGGEQAPEV